MIYKVYGLAGSDTKEIEFIDIYEFDEKVRADYITSKEYIDDALSKGMTYWDQYAMLAVVFKSILDNKEEAEDMVANLKRIINTQNIDEDVI